MTAAEPPRLALDPPPLVEEPAGAASTLVTALPVVGSIGSVALLSTTGGEARTRALVAAALFLLATVGVVVVQVDRHRQQRLLRRNEARIEYLRHLARSRAAAHAAARDRRRALLRRLPSPSALPALAAAAGGAPWPHGAGTDEPLLAVRWGEAPRPAALELVEPDAAARADPFAAAALKGLLTAHRVPTGLPAALDLRGCPRVVAAGSAERGRALARALVCSAAFAHPPETLVVAGLVDADAADRWEWLKWLPHAQGRGAGDAAGPPRLVCTDAARLTELLSALAEGSAPAPHVLVVVDAAAGDGQGAAPTPPVPPGLGHTVVRMVATAPAPVGSALVLELGPEVAGRPSVRAHVRPPGEAPFRALADQCDAATAEALARRLAPRSPQARSPATGGACLPDGVVDADPARTWRPHGPGERLRVVLGQGPAGPVQLDLKEAAEGGAGPHGLVVGATGSGKSELLRTVVLGLAAAHSPDELNLTLVDFKGGATFAGLGRLPHTAASITNLASETALVDRMEDALAGEVVRRQEVLRAAGDLASVREHRVARRGDARLPALPTLLVVVDEFTELLAARPELLDLFVAIGRLGRSLGIHLLLATQRLEEGRLRGLESHLSYRIALRTGSAAESRAVLGVPDAATLPTMPGVGLLRTGPEEPTRFHAGHVSAPVPADCAAQRAGAPPRARVAPFPAQVAQPPGPGREPEEPPVASGRSLLDVTVEVLAAYAARTGQPPPHRVWLPPLGPAVSLGDLLPEPATHDTDGLLSGQRRDPSGLALPVGVVDLPRAQRREPLVLDLAGAGGHVGVVGGPRSGRSTALRTLVCSLALTRTPRQAQALLLDLAGGGLGALADLPHVAGSATRSDPDGLRRVVARVRALAEDREARFRSDGVAELAPLRGRCGDWGDGWGEVLVVVDGWETLRAEHDDLETELTVLAGRGLAVGVHLALATHRWSDVRPALRDLLGSRVELRLGDPLESLIDRRAADRVPSGRPGRGLVDGHHVLVALPRLEDAGTEAELVARVAGAWDGAEAPRVHVLPETVALADLLPASAGAEGAPLVLGLAEDRPEPVLLDPAADRHLLVLGEPGSGRTGVLRTCLHQLVRRRPADRLQVVVLDPRRSLLGTVPADHLLDDLPDVGAAEEAVAALADRLRRRLPGPGTTASQLQERSWWHGPEVAVVVDDHDLLVGPRGSPLAALLPLLPRAGEVGLHLFLARRAAGAARTVPDPVPSLLRDVGAAGLLLSARPEDGPLLGLRPSAAPPGRARLVGRDGRPRVLQVARAAPGRTSLAAGPG